MPLDQSSKWIARIQRTSSSSGIVAYSTFRDCWAGLKYTDLLAAMVQTHTLCPKKGLFSPLNLVISGLAVVTVVMHL